MKVAMNGIDYTSENENTGFTFIGTGTYLAYWPYIIAIILGLFALIALIICCTATAQSLAEPNEAPNQEHHGRRVNDDEGNAGAALKGVHRPHTIRDEYNFIRTRGVFVDHPQSPAPGVRGSTYNQQSIRAGSIMKSPYHI